jgi:hypothetical protein
MQRRQILNWPVLVSTTESTLLPLVLFFIRKVNYAAAVAFEVRQPSSGGEPVIRFNFKNGTDDADFKTYNFMNASGDVPVSTFVNALSVRVLVVAD